MAKTIDRVQIDEVKPKASEIGNIVMAALIKSGLSADTLQRAIECGGELATSVLPIVKHLGAEVKLVDSELLQPVTIASTTAVEAFSAKAHFVTKNTPDGVSLGYIGPNFQSAFLSGTGRNEIDVPKAELRIHKLRKNSVDTPIIEELGGKERVETSSLAAMWEMMKRQGQGQQGDLLVNGYANIFYIRDDHGTLWAVDCRWDSGYRFWDVYARSVARPNEWRAGDQVFAR